MKFTYAALALLSASSLCMAQTPNPRPTLRQFVVTTQSWSSLDTYMYRDRDDFSFESLADGRRYHHFKGAKWQALVSEEYLALHKMKRFADFYREVRATNRRIVDRMSPPSVFQEIKDFYVRSNGESLLNHTESPDFAVALSHETVVVLQLGEARIRVPLPNQRPEPELEPYAVLDTFPNVSRLPEGGSSPLHSNTYAPPEFHVYSSAGTGVIPDLDLVELFMQMQSAREIQLQECRQAYGPYLEWLSESGREDRAKMRSAKRVSQLDARSIGLLRSHLTGNPGLLELSPIKTVTEFINADPAITAVYPVEHFHCSYRWSTGGESGSRIVMSQLWALPAAARSY